MTRYRKPRRVSFPPTRRADSLGCLTLAVLLMGTLLFIMASVNR